MRSAGFRYDLALRCRDGNSQCPAQYLYHIVLDGCSSQNAPVQGPMDGNIFVDGSACWTPLRVLSSINSLGALLLGSNVSPDLGQTCPDMTTRGHTCTHTCTVCRWAKVFCLH